MNSQAAKELLDLIMDDDYVTRRQNLDRWSRRWVTTMHVEFVHDGTCTKEQLPAVWRRAKEVLARQILDGLLKDEVNVLNWGRLVNDDGSSDENSLACEMHCIMQKPRG